MGWLFDALFHAVFLWVPLGVWIAVAIVAIVGVALVWRVFGWQATLAATTSTGLPMQMRTVQAYVHLETLE